MILPIIKFGDLRLETPAEKVLAIDDEIKQLVADMVQTMHNEPGIGLAANQVGELRRVAVVDLSVGENPDDLIVLINPEIVEEEGEQVEEEGCLSFPEISVKLARPQKLVVRATNLANEEFTIEAEGLLARALAHEIDHLSGVVIIDHIRGMAKQMTLTRIKQLKRQGLWD